MTDKLLDGFKQFYDEEYAGHKGTMPELVAKGQNPDYFIISCIDSRSNPGTIFRAPPGAFFAHKAMGAIVRPYKKGTALAAALQFAIAHMNVTKLVILGHTHCGAIQALVDKIEDEDIASFVQIAQDGLDCACEKTGTAEKSDDLLREAEKQIVLQSAKNIKTYPSVAKALEENRLTIKPWLFNMESGNIEEYDDKSGDFVPITNHTPDKVAVNSGS